MSTTQEDISAWLEDRFPTLYMEVDPDELAGLIAGALAAAADGGVMAGLAKGVSALKGESDA